MENETPSRKFFYIGWTISGLSILFFILDAVMKLLMLKNVIDINVKLGYPENVVFWMGLTLLISALLYLIPLTALFGAILLTAYLGGATATHVRIHEPFIFPVIFGILVWIGLFLRDKRYAAWNPFKKI